MNEPQNSNVPYFAAKFHNLYFHDYFSLPENYDMRLKETLEKFEPNFQKDTMLVLMSDHGHRLNRYSQTIEGQNEHSNPFLSIKIPNQFKNTKFLDNFISNKDKSVNISRFEILFKNISLSVNFFNTF